ncbi:MAG: hypothetical protein WAM95_21425 [Bacillus sp. (in: firmicutes)]
MSLSKILPYVLLIVALIFGGYQFKQHHDIKAAYSELDNQYSALSNNSKVKVQDDATNFLKAFYTYEDRPKKENINGLTTEKVQDTLFQTYEALDKEFEMPQDIKYKSGVDNITIYHARDEYDTNAKVLATFESIITINGKKSHTKSIAEISLELKDKKWIVTQYKTLNDVSNFEGN